MILVAKFDGCGKEGRPDGRARELSQDNHTPPARTLFVNKRRRNAQRSRVLLLMSGGIWPPRMTVSLVPRKVGAVTPPPESTLAQNNNNSH